MTERSIVLGGRSRGTGAARAMKVVKVVAGGISAAIVALFGLAGVAQAQPSQGSATSAPQARAAGLTADQAVELQQAVDGYVIRTGGTQVGLNKINLHGTGMLVVAVPGELRARDLSARADAVSPQAAPPCYSGDLCTYSGPSYTGSYAYYYACRRVGIPFPRSTNGSWKDNQTGGVPTTFYRSDGKTWTVYPGSHDANMNWTQYDAIQVC